MKKIAGLGLLFGAFIFMPNGLVASFPHWRPPPQVKSHQESESAPNEGLIQSVVRAYAWMHSLRDGSYKSVESLADANQLHPKVVRQALRLAFLSPTVASAILEGSQPAGLLLSQIPKLLPLAWTEHQRMLG
jgi:hypothetical protein